MSLLLFLATALAARPHWEPQSGMIESYNLVVMAISDNRPQDALALLAPILTEDPDCGRCQSAQAIALLRTDHADEALSIVEALSIPHDRPEVHTLRAVAASAVGDHGKARDAAMRSVNQDPASVAAQRVLLTELLILGEHEAAQRVLRLAHKHLDQPEAACLGVAYALAVDNLPGARGAMSQCRSAADPRLIQELELRLARTEGDLTALARHASALGLTALSDKADAARHLQAGEIDAARALLDGVLGETPDDVDALLLQAWCHQAEGATNDGLIDLDRIQDLTDAPHLLADGSLRQLHSPEDLRAQAGSLRIMLLLDDSRLEDARLILDRQGVNNVTAAASVRVLLKESGPEAAATQLDQIVQQWPDAPQLPRVALQIAETQPPSPALIGWIQSLQEREPTYRMAALQHHRGAHGSCLTLLAPLSDSRSLVLAHRCAVSDGATIEADRLLSMLQKSGVTPETDATLRHAWLLGEAGIPDRALTLLEGLSAEGEQALALRSLTVSLSVDAGSLKPALLAAQEGPITPEHRAHLARALYESGRPRQGIHQMATACAELDGPPRQDCHDALTQMKATP
ncbi:MAG: hypothetical protein ACI8RZ_005078 [Myxococcota bacterium]|jgi:hypothetical protein